jgi:hypothetical protein
MRSISGGCHGSGCGGGGGCLGRGGCGSGCHGGGGGGFLGGTFPGGSFLGVSFVGTKLGGGCLGWCLGGGCLGGGFPGGSFYFLRGSCLCTSSSGCLSSSSCLFFFPEIEFTLLSILPVVVLAHLLVFYHGAQHQRLVVTIASRLGFVILVALISFPLTLTGLIPKFFTRLSSFAIFFIHNDFVFGGNFLDFIAFNDFRARAFTEVSI